MCSFKDKFRIYTLATMSEADALDEKKVRAARVAVENLTEAECQKALLTADARLQFMKNIE
jgi:hypothetical protein